MGININKEPLVSIIIPFYNTEDYIDISINSIKKQTYKNIELILINDGSIDNTQEKAVNLLNDSNIKYRIIEQKNSGVSYARNRGIDSANGEYIYFLDSDDYIEETFIEKMISKVVKDNLDTVFCGCDIAKGDRVTTKYTDMYSYMNDNKKGIDVIKLDLKEIIHIWTINVMFRREILVKNNIKYNTNTYYAEDVELIYKILFNSEKVGCVRESLVYYNQRADSASYNFSIKRFTGIGAMNRLKYYLSNVKDKELIQLINNRFCMELLMIYDQYIFSDDCKLGRYDYIFKGISRKNIQKFKIISTRTLKQFILLNIFRLDYKLYKKIKLAKHNQ